MSERGSFVTEFIYCEKCLTALKKIFFKDKYLNQLSIFGKPLFLFIGKKWPILY